MHELRAVLDEQKILIASLKVTSAELKRSIRQKPQFLSTARRLNLLRMTEALIAAHKVAKLDDDGMTIDLIEDALRHVGVRLAKETGDGRKFSRKRLGSL